MHRHRDQGWFRPVCLNSGTTAAVPRKYCGKTGSSAYFFFFADRILAMVSLIRSLLRKRTARMTRLMP